MNDEVITAEERRCLRMWFRQAIAQVEREEVRASITAEILEDKQKDTHSLKPAPRRSRRNRAIPHLRELVF